MSDSQLDSTRLFMICSQKTWAFSLIVSRILKKNENWFKKIILWHLRNWGWKCSVLVRNGRETAFGFSNGEFKKNWEFENLKLRCILWLVCMFMSTTWTLCTLGHIWCSDSDGQACDTYCEFSYCCWGRFAQVCQDNKIYNAHHWF